MKKTTRDYSSLQEQQIARKLNGRVTPNSGGTRFGGGDVLTEHFLIEAKTPMTTKKSFSIKEEWLLKMQEQTFEQGKFRSALTFRFSPDAVEDYYVLSEREFQEYCDLIANCTNGGDYK